MQEIKIYLSRRKLITNLVASITIILVLIAYFFLGNIHPIQNIGNLIILAFLIYYIYSTVFLIRRIRRQIPSVVFSEFTIDTTKELKSESYSLAEIEDWRILQHAESQEIALTIHGKQKFIEISELDIKLRDIRTILEEKLPGKEFIEK